MKSAAPEIPAARAAPRLPAWQAVPPKPGRDVKLPALFLAIVVLFMLPRMLVTIYPGQVGVVFHRFRGGTEIAPGAERGEGFHVIAPWDLMQRYQLRLQTTTAELTVLSKEGLEIRVDATAQYRPIKEEVGLLHRDVGPEYLERLVRPEVTAVLRVAAARRSADEICAARIDLQEEASAAATAQLAGRHVRIEGLFITAVHLPEAVQRAIDDKQRRAQLALEYDFRLVQEEKEATRKQIEARGIREFQDAAGGISESFLRLRSIEATLELARSSNAKLVVLGGAPGSPPIILNAGLDAAPAPSVPAPASSAPAPASSTSAPSSAGTAAAVDKR